MQLTKQERVQSRHIPTGYIEYRRQGDSVVYARGTAWESGVVEYIKEGRAYLLYGVTRLNDWGGIRGMCTGEPLSRLERI